MTPRATITKSSLEAWIRREFTSRARRALSIYTRTPLVRDDPSYPFAQRPEDGKIRSAQAQSIRRIPGGVRITVQSRGAPFLEEGNDAGGSTINGGRGGLALPLKGAAGKRGARYGKAARKAGGRKGSVYVGPDGRAYLMVQRVRTYRGRNQLENSVRAAFGIGGRRRA